MFHNTAQLGSRESRIREAQGKAVSPSEIMLSGQIRKESLLLIGLLLEGDHERGRG